MQEEKKEKYKNVIAFRVDDATMEYLNKLEAETGLRQSSVIRMILENARDNSTVNVTSKTDYQSMKELVREVNKIGMNINQIVRSANEHFYTKYEKKKLFAMTEKINEMIAKQFDLE